jgi:hypothetical protein
VKIPRYPITVMGEDPSMTVTELRLGKTDGKRPLSQETLVYGIPHKGFEDKAGGTMYTRTPRVPFFLGIIDFPVWFFSGRIPLQHGKTEAPGAEALPLPVPRGSFLIAPGA